MHPIKSKLRQIKSIIAFNDTCSTVKQEKSKAQLVMH